MQYLKRILPFTLTFIIGVGLGGFAGLFQSRTVERTGYTYLGDDFGHRGRECKNRFNVRNYARAYKPGERERRGRTNVVATQSFPADAAMFERGSKWQPVTILRSPDPSYTRDARSNGTQGVVRLSVIFGADGKTKIEEVISPLSDGLTEAATEAVRSIEFTPATLSGKPVSTHGVVDCIF